MPTLAIGYFEDATYQVMQPVRTLGLPARLRLCRNVSSPEPNDDGEQHSVRVGIVECGTEDLGTRERSRVQQ